MKDEDLMLLVKQGDIGLVAIGKETEEDKTIELRFSEGNDLFGASIFEDAEIRLKLDNLTLMKWQAGGEQQEGLEYIGDGLFLITNENPKLQNLTFEGSERGSMHIGFNMLTEEVEDKVVYKFYAEQYDAEGFIGGEQYLIHRDERNLFIADVGVDETIEEGESIQLRAYLIGEAATYKWYNQAGGLFFTGVDTTFVPEDDEVFTLEVTAHDAGYKDYDEKVVTVKHFFISEVYPNPTNNQSSVTVNYEASAANSAYLVLTNMSTNVSITYVLNLSHSTFSIQTSNLTPGSYQLQLNCNGQFQDSKTVIIN